LVCLIGSQDKSLPDGSFKLVHYAGDVIYTSAGFLEKNTDTLYKDLSRVGFSIAHRLM
jgi:myosin-1